MLIKCPLFVLFNKQQEEKKHFVFVSCTGCDVYIALQGQLTGAGNMQKHSVIHQASQI